MCQLVEAYLERHNDPKKDLPHVAVLHTILADPDLPTSENIPDRLAWMDQQFAARWHTHDHPLPLE